VEFFFIDTSPLVHEYHDAVWADNKGQPHRCYDFAPASCASLHGLQDILPWQSRPSSDDNAGGILEQSPEAQLKELEGRLARSRAEWKVVVGHHPIRSDLQVSGAYLLTTLTNANWLPPSSFTEVDVAGQTFCMPAMSCS
jgi:hypothetical protein